MILLTGQRRTIVGLEGYGLTVVAQRPVAGIDPVAGADPIARDPR